MRFLQAFNIDCSSRSFKGSALELLFFYRIVVGCLYLRTFLPYKGYLENNLIVLLLLILFKLLIFFCISYFINIFTLCQNVASKD